MCRAAGFIVLLDNCWLIAVYKMTQRRTVKFLICMKENTSSQKALTVCGHIFQMLSFERVFLHILPLSDWRGMNKKKQKKHS